MAKARLHTITRNDLDAYEMPRFRSNPGVVAIMGITNGRGAYARRNGKVIPIGRGKKAAAKKGKPRVGGAGCHKSPRAKYVRQGSTERSHYAFPECWAYPVRTARKANETTEHWHERDKKAVKRALSRFGKYKNRYSNEVRNKIGLNIARAARAVGQDSPKAMEYRIKYGLDKAPKRAGKAELKLAANRSKESSMLFYRSRVRRNSGLSADDMAPTIRRASPPSFDEGFIGPALGYDPRTGMPRYTRKRGTRAARPVDRESMFIGPPLGFDPMTGEPIYTRKAMAAAKARAAKAKKEKPMAAKKAKKAKAGKKAKTAKKPGRKAGKKAKTAKKPGRKAGKKAKKAGKKAKAAKKPGRKAGKRKSKKSPIGRKLTASRKAAMAEGAAKYRRRMKKLRKEMGTTKYLAQVRAKRAEKAARKAARGGKKVKANRRRRPSFLRRNAGGFVATMMPYLKLGGEALVGFAVHRFASKPVASLMTGVVEDRWSNLLSALVVAGVGTWAAKRFLPKFAVGLVPGMLVSAGAVALKSLLPDFASTVGISGLETVSTLPRYGTGSFMQASAGFQQAAAGEYFSLPQGTGEYVSSDLYGTGGMGEYELRKLDVLGDTGSYELTPTYGTGEVPTYDGVRPEQADTFLQAMAGIEDKSTYIPHEAERGISTTESSFDAGIFDAGNVLNG